MRGKLVMAGALGALAGAAGLWVVSVVAAPEFHLRGGRFRPLSYEELNPAQKALADAALASGRKSFDGPLNINLRSPEMAKLAAPLTDYLRFKSTAIPPNLKQIGIMLTARFWGGQYVWYSHRQQALDAGLDPAFISAMAAGQRPANMSADEAAVYDFCSELLSRRQVSDANFNNMVERFGERGVVETVGLMGHFHTLTMLFVVDKYPVPEGPDAIKAPM